MRNRAFEIVTLSDHNKGYGLRDPITIGLNVLDGIMRIFGGGSSSGLPGDYDNRVRQSHQWMVERGVTECVDFNKLERIITGSGIWQAQVEIYADELKGQKQRTGSCQSVFGGGGGGGATLFSGVGFSPVVALGLIGVAIFLLKDKKRRR